MHFCARSPFSVNGQLARAAKFDSPDRSKPSELIVQVRLPPLSLSPEKPAPLTGILPVPIPPIPSSTKSPTQPFS